MTNSFSGINTFLDSTTSENPILKKLIRVGAVALVPIHESLLNELLIDEDTWIEEISTAEGIFLKISSKKIGSSPEKATKKEEMPT